MVLIISQETFDEAVQENINDLGMEPDEAVSEAIGQFKAQGVDLSQVITEIGSSSSFENIISCIKALARFKEKPISDDCAEHLLTLKQECDKGIQYKVQAGKIGAYDKILDVFLNGTCGKDLKIASLETMIALMDKQPDLLDQRGVRVILSNLEASTDLEIKRLILKWAKISCIMHENNRQCLFNSNILQKLIPILKNENTNLLRDMLGVIRALILDDDVRVDFGKAHEHARVIAAETLSPITALLKKLKTEELVVCDLMMTLSALLVRAEFCLQVDEIGGLELVKAAMTNFIESDKVIRQGFKLSKALAGNDQCKVHIIQKGFAPLIQQCLNRHMDSCATAALGLGCIAAIALRSPDNSKALFEAGIPEVVVEVMRRHPEDKSIQKNASWVIRNMVSRSRYQNNRFLELGVEDLLQANLAKFKDCEYDLKAALRDLECNVELKEEWTGKGGKLSTESVKKH